MKLEDAKRKALMLMREWSIDGIQQVGVDIADYSESFNDFADIAQKQIAERRPIEASYQISQTASTDTPITFNRFTMPDDFKQVRKVIYEDGNGHYCVMTDYMWEGKKTFVLPSNTGGTFTIYYDKYPTSITPDTEDSYEFEVDEDVQELIPFFMAAHALMEDAPDRATQKLNEYYSRLERIVPLADNNFETIKNIKGW